MALTPAETDRLLTQHGEDILEIYSALGRIEQVQSQHTRSLRDHDQRFDGVDQRFDGVDQRFDGVDLQLEGMDKRLERVDSQLGEVLEILRGQDR